MESVVFFPSHSKSSKSSPNCANEQGFVLVSTLVLIPFLVALFTAVVTVVWVLKRRSLAQSLCVSHSVRMQDDLGDRLQELLRLNPKATKLRAQRQAADREVDAANASGIVPLIVAARAHQAYVILSQVSLRTQQQTILNQAEAQARQHEAQLRHGLARIGVHAVQANRFFPLALAVRPTPITSISPNFEPVRPFTFLQKRSFAFALPLGSALNKVFPNSRDSFWRQPMGCSASLADQEEQWRVRILAASPRSS